MLSFFQKEQEKQPTRTETASAAAENATTLTEADVLESLPNNIILCKPSTGQITYANATSRHTVELMGESFPVTPDALEGASINIFSDGGEDFEAMVGDPAALPFNRVLPLGSEFLELRFNILRDKNGSHERTILSWTRVTERETFKAEAGRLTQMVDKMPINAMMCDPQTGAIVYMNDSSKAALAGLAQHLSVSADAMVGQNLSVFCQELQQQPGLLVDPKKLPFKTKFELGPETIGLSIHAITDDHGGYIGPMATWAIVTAQAQVEAMVSQSSGEVAAETASLADQASMMASIAEQNIGISSKVADASGQATDNVQAVAAATEELANSISQIADQVAHASRISGNASEKADQANTVGQELSEASGKISDVVKLINDIADQTNLLALNATIEAARAGEAGKGFAVVASEVKSLATQTAKATEDISHQVESIQEQSRRMVESITEISEIIREVTAIATEIDGSTNQQGAATQEISRSVDQAAQRTKEVSDSMDEVQQASQKAADVAHAVQASADRLTEVANGLQHEVSNLLK
ncbi:MULTISPECIES: methyl-accepting chemotaxis protein [Kordiimonas]|jgi:methyl-accepting chemotaxis protein|uniref:methyl-accepting chemotaxis protein n=1 Tax=Kordiimonas TaxID=288021 RepID=UPI00257B6EEE|nr:methyl-accepting chemotaxis protein [Kordiimonas sp. UBA4487]